MKFAKLYSSVILVFVMAGYVSATQIAQSTIYIDAYDDPGVSGWNSVNFSAVVTKSNLVDSNAAITAVGVKITKRMLTNNDNATPNPIGDALEFAPAGVRQSYGCNSNWNVAAGSHYTQCVAEISGLLPGTNYTFTFYASRMGVGGENREALYSLTGANSGSAALDPSENTNKVAVVSGIAADSNGEIQLIITPGPNNVNTVEFFYLLAMKIEGVMETGFDPPILQPQHPVYLNIGGSTIANPVATGIGNTEGTVYANLVDSNNVASALSLKVKTRLSGPRSINSSYLGNFTGDALQFGTACLTGVYGENSHPYGEYEISGAEENYRYTFTFFGCREGQNDIREARFVVDGVASSTNYLNASSNYSKVAVIDSAQCDANGMFKITVEKGPNNTNTSYWSYLNAMKIEAVMLPPSGTIILLR